MDAATGPDQGGPRVGPRVTDDDFTRTAYPLAEGGLPSPALDNHSIDMRVRDGFVRKSGDGDTRRLVVAPHCDDEVMGCGGLLTKYAEESAVVVLGRPDDVREKEFNAARQVLGYQTAYFLDMADGYVGSDMHRLVGALDRVLADCCPEEMYLPYPSMHQDHISAYEGGMRAARLSMSAGHWFTPTIMVYDVAAYDVVLYPTDLRWNMFETLSETQIDRKVTALAAYASQQVGGPHPANGVKQTAAAVGSARRVAWAEQYALVRCVR